jgi:predicted O-linked N-acetylglucosamine transferase (SPINDLY family)
MNPQLQVMMQQVIQSFKDENLESATSILNEVLQNDIRNADTIFELGHAYAKANRLTEAMAIFYCLQPHKNGDVRIPYNLGLIHSLQGMHQLALEAYDLALKIQPEDVEVLINKGSTCNDIKDYVLALDVLEKAIKKTPNIPEAWSNKGIALNNLNLYQEAISAYDEAIRLNPRFYEAWSNKSAPLNKLKRFLEAFEACDVALNLKPDYAEGWSNKGTILYELKRYDEALAHYDKALNLKPNFTLGWLNKGAILYELKRYDDALNHYDHLLSLKPDCAEGWCNKGATLDELKRYDEALAHHDQAISLKPDYAEGWFNKGNTLHKLKRYDEALAHYNKAFSLKPDIKWLYGKLAHIKTEICNWSDLMESLEVISKKLTVNEKVTQPFPLLALNDDALLHKKASEIYIQDKYPLNTALGPILRRLGANKIRLGYFSADFHNHATGYLIAELFELHDKGQFELVGFSFGPITNDEIRQRLDKSFSKFIEVGNRSDIEIAQLSRSLNIDIAVDLKGFTQDSRTGIFSYRAAPIQVSYLGYPGTMGVEYIDYIIADRTLVPVESQAYYSEKVVYLPNSYQANDRKRYISDKQFTRQELGLPKHGFVFCCFNNNYKILPKTFASWMRILNAVEGSVLWLFQDNPWVVDNLKSEALNHGIKVSRLIFAERIALPDHLARHHQADLFLDTLPYNAHTTASDALWTGLPVLTLMGRSFASRVAGSLLNAVGLPELITNAEEEFEALAIDLAMNPRKLADIKLKLKDNRLTAPLFDTPLFTKNIESAYIKMHEIYRADIPPDHIYI